MWSMCLMPINIFPPRTCIILIFPCSCHDLRQAFLCYFSLPTIHGVNWGTSQLDQKQQKCLKKKKMKKKWD